MVPFSLVFFFLSFFNEDEILNVIYPPPNEWRLFINLDTYEHIGKGESKCLGTRRASPRKKGTGFL